MKTHWMLTAVAMVLLFAACTDKGAGSITLFEKPDGQVVQILPDGKEEPVDLRDGYAETTVPAGRDLAGWNPGNTGTTGGLVTESAAFALVSSQSCEEVTNLWRQAAISAMESAMSSAMHATLTTQDCSWKYEDWTVYDCISEADSTSSYEEVTEGEEEGASEYSTTNTQEVDVDEADFIKNDGNFIYILADGALQIFDVWPPEQAHSLSKTVMPGTPTRLYVEGNRAVVYSNVDPVDSCNQYDYDCYAGLGSQCTYGYDCEFTGEAGFLTVTVWDITDKANPVKTRESRYSGSYLNSRRIDDRIYTMVYFGPPSVPEVSYIPDALRGYQYRCFGDPLPQGYDEAAVIDAFETLRQQNVAYFNGLDVAHWLPSVEDFVYDASGHPTALDTPLSECTSYFLSQTNDGMSMVSLISFELEAQQPLTATTILGKPGAVYASKQSLYLATRHYKDYNYSYGYYDPYLYDSIPNVWFAELPEEVSQATTIHKFVLDNDSAQTTYAGSGLVVGRVLNQFAMSEYQGNLRIATTHGFLPDPAVYNLVTILTQGEGALPVVGQLTGLAPGEDIRSVRFSGDKGYVVTFKKTDPLFVIDLSDPTKPVAAGELKIPGFSTYMHFMDETHILSIGFDADDQGSFAWFAGLQLQVFDVTDMTNPSLLYKEVIGTRGSNSEATTNHLAFNFFKPKDLLLFPMVVCEGGEGGSYGEQMTFNGLMAYNVTLAEGFKYLGGIQWPTTSDFSYEDSWGYSQQSTCFGWWSSSPTQVKRSVVMDDYIFAIALDEIRVAKLDAINTLLATLPLLGNN